MIIDVIADLHGHYCGWCAGDLLIVAGDLTVNDSKRKMDEFWAWLCYQPHEKKIVIAGNHDNFLENNPHYFDGCSDDIMYLCDSWTEVGGYKIWGSPWTKSFEGMNSNCMAFCVDTEEELQEKWDLIPDDTDILVTHSPPRGILDQNVDGDACGSETLLSTLERVKPKIHVFGHIHEQGGRKERHNSSMALCMNASYVDENYQPVNQKIRINLDGDIV